MEGYYKNGQLKQLTEDGIRTHYFENGKVKATGPFDGKMQGEWSFYRKTGELWQVGHLNNDSKDGRWVRYHRNGDIEKDTQFDDGKEMKS
ncbi:MAG: hypothetical protein ABS896_09995 [Carnobacterium inhibens]|uniref:toxin-antitoxin system YwqK family antitoxin n=1 Tax=Carnobacterium inhibens TaxID=147709 RepID=UPI0033147D89